MTKTFLRYVLPWLSILLILCLLTACDGGKQPPADTPAPTSMAPPGM